MRNLDFSSWQALLVSLLGLVFITLLGVGVRLVMMQTIQQKREREDRQINERLRTLIAAYKTLGGSFTGSLHVDPVHKRELKQSGASLDGSDRGRRTRDAVEAALSDIILLGTEEQVRLATQAAQELVAGRRVETAELVVSLRDFIRKALDLDPIPGHVAVPRQGPARPGNSSGKKGEGKDAAAAGGGKGGGGGGMGAAGGMGMGMGMGAGMGGMATHAQHDDAEDDLPR